MMALLEALEACGNSSGWMPRPSSRTWMVTAQPPGPGSLMCPWSGVEPDRVVQRFQNTCKHRAISPDERRAVRAATAEAELLFTIGVEILHSVGTSSTTGPSSG